MRGIEHIPWLYDASMWVFEALGLDRLRRRLISRARGRVLEVGCGTGRNLPLYPASLAVIGIDVDLALLLAARRRQPSAVLVIATVEALPFRAASFETIVSSLVFCSVPDPLRGLGEIRRTLSPAGHLQMLEHVRVGGLGGRVQDLIQPPWTCLVGGCYPNRETEKHLEQAGFVMEKRWAKGVLRLLAIKVGSSAARDPLC